MKTFSHCFQMKTDFKKMEEEMDRLATNMDAITDFSAKISGTLQDRREQITKLSSVHMLLKKVGHQTNTQHHFHQKPVHTA